MSARWPRWLAAAIFVVSIALTLAAVVMLFGSLDEPTATFGFRGGIPLITLVLAAVGGMVAWRRPENPIGWLLLLAGLLSAIQSFAQEYAVWGTRGALQLPWVVIAGWIDAWIWAPIVAAMGIFVLLIFPTGRLRSPRWRVAVVLGTLGTVMFAVAMATYPGKMQVPYGAVNPFGSRAVTDAAFILGGPLFLGSLALAVSSLVLRYRDATAVERQQVKWLALGASFVLAALAATAVFSVEGSAGPRIVQVLVLLALASIPITIGIAVLRYRLFDIDVVINRTVLYGLLAAFVTATYVGLVVGVGALVGTRGNLLLSILATAVIALVFQPARERARRLANRLVYGKRATPYEVLSDFGERLAGSYATDDVLPRLARVVGEGVGAARSRIWLRVGRELRPVGEWPDGSHGGAPVELPGDGLPSFDPEDRAFEVRHQGELLGAITVSMPPRAALTPTSERLLQDLAAHAGLILRNVRLIEELRASRQRIVAAQDDERRRLERDIHDGAQQQLVALAVNLKLARTLSAKDPKKAQDLLGRLQDEAQAAMDDLRDLARGIYPPLLADKGLAAALEAQARKAAVPIRVEPDSIGRYSQETEAATYFCVLEALQNAAKYAEASSVTVRLSQQDGDLVFTVTDDGRGFDPATTPRGSGLQNMADRLEALGGSVAVRSAPGEGTTVTGRMPVQAPVA